MDSSKQFQIETEQQGSRLDHFLSKQIPALSRSKLQKVIEQGCVFVNGFAVKKNYILKVNDIVVVDERSLILRDSTPIEGQDISLSILFEDEDIIIINKPAGLVVHPGHGNLDHTLVNALVFHGRALSQGTAPERPGIVHRLDKDTSGVMIIAKNDVAHMKLSIQFQQRTVRKEYTGICIGKQPAEQGIIDAPIGRQQHDPIKFSITSSGKPAITHYTCIKYSKGVSVVALYPRSGRTHQIRVHCLHSGFPIVKDPLYKRSLQSIIEIQPSYQSFIKQIEHTFTRHALHARRIQIQHPMTGENMAFTADFPNDFLSAFQYLGIQPDTL